MRSFLAAILLACVTAGVNLAVAPYRAPVMPAAPIAVDLADADLAARARHNLESLAPAPAALPIAPAIEAADPYNFAAEYFAPAVLIEVLPMPRPRPAPVERGAAVDQAPAVTPIALLAEAGRWIGKGARDLGVRRSLWCAAAINKFLQHVGLDGTGSDAAASFAHYGKPIAEPRPGAIAVKYRYARGRLVGGHVVIVKAVDKAHGRVVVISPNAGKGAGLVRVSTYPIKAFYAWRLPAA